MKKIYIVFLLCAVILAGIFITGCTPADNGIIPNTENQTAPENHTGTPEIVIDDPLAVQDIPDNLTPDNLVPENTHAAHKNTYGNTAANIMNGGYMAAQGNITYYTNSNDGDKIYKAEPDNADTKISTVNGREINVYGADIYFRGNGMFGTFYTVKTDGSAQRQLLNKRISCLHIYGGYAYFLNESDGDTVCKYNLETEENTVIISSPVFYLHLYNGNLYFQQYNGGSYKLYSCNLDGGNIKLIADLKQNTRAIAFSDNEIFYRACVTVSGKLKYRLYAMDLTGGNQRLVTANEPYHINIIGDTVFYSNADSANRLFAIKKDGTGGQKLSDTVTDTLYNINDTLYYLGLVSGQGYKLIKL